MAFNLKQVDKFFQNVRGWPHSHGAWTLERAALLPPADAFFAEQLAAVVALDRVSRDFEADAANQLILKFTIHHAVQDAGEVVATLVEVLWCLLDGASFALGAFIAFLSLFWFIILIGTLRSIANANHVGLGDVPVYLLTLNLLGSELGRNVHVSLAVIRSHNLLLTPICAQPLLRDGIRKDSKIRK